MNTLINQYLQSMDFFVSFHLDEEFKEDCKRIDIEMILTNNFSEGEKMRIDLNSIYLAWLLI